MIIIVIGRIKDYEASIGVIMFNSLTSKPLLSKQDLYDTPEQDLIRLSNYLKLKTKSYSHKQRARLVYWLLTRRHRMGYY